VFISTICKALAVHGKHSKYPKKKMDFLPKKIDDYILAHSQHEPQLLQELNRETWQKVLNPRMLSGEFQGRVLSMISKLIQPKTILEIGTYTGYSALCLAEGLAPNGELHTLDRNEELFDLQRAYFDKSPYKDQIHQHLGTALDLLPQFNQKFDLVFVDADKENYSNYFHLIIDKMNPGGVILSDNVLWSGKVVEALDPKDIDTAALLEYNRLLNEDPRLETVLLPIRDGLTLSRVR
jgi:caffeoyl-CoA O-methyltransferase